MPLCWPNYNQSAVFGEQMDTVSTFQHVKSHANKIAELALKQLHTAESCAAIIHCLYDK
jgi:hypothetical protein